jgi:hypothetical protein
MQKIICITPEWETSTHKNLFRDLCLNLNFTQIKTNEINRFHYFRSLLYFFKYIFIFLFKKNDIRNIYFKNINIGYSINEESIARSKNAKCNFNLDLLYLIYFSINYILNIENFINNYKKKSYKIVGLGGDEVYIKFSLISQYFKLNNFKIYFLKGGNKINYFEYDLKNLNAFFVPSNIEDVISHNTSITPIIDSLLENGDHVYSYMNKRVYTNLVLPVDSIIIYLSDFFDSPGAYGYNIFPNHIMHLNFTLNFLIKNNINNIFIKPHPNQSKKNKAVLNNFLKDSKFKDIKILNDFNLKDNKDNIKFILSFYGTIIFESSLFGIPVLTTGNNPYKILHNCIISRNIKEYENNLKFYSYSSKKINVDLDFLKKFESFYFNKLNKYNLPYDNISFDQWRILFPNIDYIDQGMERYIYIKKKNIYFNYNNFTDFKNLCNDLLKEYRK